jgi:hypothetical protein
MTPVLLVTPHAIQRAKERVSGLPSMKVHEVLEWIDARVKESWDRRRGVLDEGMERLLVPLFWQDERVGYAMLRDSLETSEMVCVLTILTVDMVNGGFGCKRFVRAKELDPPEVKEAVVRMGAERVTIWCTHPGKKTVRFKGPPARVEARKLELEAEGYRCDLMPGGKAP